MSSAEHLKQVVSDKLAAVAEEIFAVFHNAIAEYEEELDRQRKLLELAWKPVVKLDRIELPQKLVLKEQLILEDQSSLNQDWSSTADQEEEVSSVELKLKEEPEDLKLCSANETSIKKEDPTVDGNPEEPSQESEDLIPVLTSVVSTANSDLSLSPGVSQSQELNEDECQNSRSTRHKKDPNCNIHKSQSDEDLIVTLTKSNRSLTNDQKFKCKSKVQKHRKGNVDKNHHVHERLEVSSCETVLQRKRVHAGKKQHVCQTCGKSFSKISKLKKHKILHTSERPYVCKTCGSSFTHKGSLSRHKKIHASVRPHVCQTCGKEFNLRTNLTQHERIHTGEKPFVCQICSKSFRTSSQMTKHRRVHTGEKPFVCQICSKGFTTRSHLKIHAIVHEKPYVCQTCSKGFKLSIALDKHEKNHTVAKPFVCQTCGIRFRYRCQIIQHEATHTGERPYVCQTCGKGFRTLTQLNMHQSVHTGERPHVCQTCSKGFRLKGDLRIHELIHIA